MFLTVLRKILNNKWMFACLLIGSILAVAMISSIPMYTNGVLQRMLTKDLEQYQADTGRYPGRYQAEARLYSYFDREDRIKAFHMFDNRISDRVAYDLNLPITKVIKRISLGNFLYIDPSGRREEGGRRDYVRVQALTELEDHITMVHGHMYAEHKVDGVFEVIVTEGVMKDFELILGNTYTLVADREPIDDPLRMKVVGVFAQKDTQDTYWYQGLHAYDSSFLMDYSLFYDEIIEKDIPLVDQVQWNYVFDYSDVTINDIETIMAAHTALKAWTDNYRAVEMHFPVASIIDAFGERERQLRTTLLILNVPLLIMLAFYLFMVSRLIINGDKNEIAVLTSRGASRFQIFILYLIESCMLGGAALLLGPFAAMLMVKILGSSNGFLEFVSRTGLPVIMSTDAYIHALIAAIVSIAAMLIPAIMTSRMSIVQHKQKKSGIRAAAIWEKLLFDFILLAVSLYGLHVYHTRQDVIMTTGAHGMELTIDPLLFVISTVFILGAGLLFLHIYPTILQLVFKMGRRIWSPVLYASFIQVGRAGSRDLFLMLFLILTIAVGLFNANAARTINNNMEEKLRYSYGADMMMTARWENNKPTRIVMPTMGGQVEAERSVQTDREPILYEEPPFLPFSQLPGAAMATKVFRTFGVTAETPVGSNRNVDLMGIIPNEFGKVAWFREDLMDYHWYNYLNFMSQDPRAVLLSTAFQEDYNMRVGEQVSITWGSQSYMEAIIYGFIDYWPTFNPLSENGSPYFIVANLHYIHAVMAMEPYEVWISKAPNAPSQQIVDAISENNIQLVDFADVTQQIIASKNDPLLQGTNGALTMGFVISMLISTIGFLLYWIISIKGRVLTFGIFKAMGLSRSNLLGILAAEQILVSGVAIMVGIIVGGTASDLFVPLFQITYSAAQQIPPFKIAAYAGDYIKLYIVVLTMLAMGFTVLGMLVARIRIAQALKLGED